jgi:hypothetical protein
MYYGQNTKDINMTLFKLRAVCMSNIHERPSTSVPHILPLTVGKAYDAEYVKNKLSPWHVINDDGRSFWYDEERFKLLDEIRQEKLNELGI